MGAPDKISDTEVPGGGSPELYSKEDREWALYVLGEVGGSLREAAEVSGISRETIRRWRNGEVPGDRPGRGRVRLSYGEKRALVDRLAAGERAAALAEEAGVTPQSITNWRRRLLEEGELSIMGVDDVEGMAAEPREPEGDVDELRARVRQLELRNAILEQTIEILKKDPGADASALTNREKATVARALRGRFGLGDLLGALGLARSTYYDQARAMDRPDRYARLRARVAEVFRAKEGAWGSERIWAELRRPHDGADPVVVSEKVVRRIMREEGLVVVYRKKARRYSSYRGETGAHPGNKVNRDFHADRPNALWLTDITQFALPGFKCYLSPVIDCFDGRVVAWTCGTSPDAELANSMLRRACATLAEGERPTIHSDCGCHYRWPGWIAECEAHGLTRSMSAKGCSPDNSACEGFFGRLKNEFFYHRDWSGVTFGEFRDLLAAYIEAYNETRIKKSLGWMSPNEYRRSKGYAA